MCPIEKAALEERLAKGYLWPMLWRLLQITTAAAVISINIYFEITDNPVIVTATAGFAAMGATWLVSKLLDLSRLQARHRRHKQTAKGLLIPEPLGGLPTRDALQIARPDRGGGLLHGPLGKTWRRDLGSGSGSK